MSCWPGNRTNYPTPRKSWRMLGARHLALGAHLATLADGWGRKTRGEWRVGGVGQTSAELASNADASWTQLGIGGSHVSQPSAVCVAATVCVLFVPFRAASVAFRERDVIGILASVHPLIAHNRIQLLQCVQELELRSKTLRS